MNDNSRRQGGYKKRATGYSMLPADVLKKAEQKVPAIKWAWGIAGIVAAVAMIKGLNLGMRTAILGTGVMLVLMIILVLFARFAKSSSRVFQIPVLIMVYFAVGAFMACVGLLLSSVFVDWPIHLTKAVFPEAQSSQTEKRQSHIDSALHESGKATGVSRVADETAKHTSDPLGRRLPLRKNENETADLSTISAVNCDDPEADHYTPGTVTTRQAFMGSFQRPVLDGLNNFPLPGIEVFCGSSGQEKTKTDVDGVFSCNLPAHSTSLLIEIIDPKYEHFHKPLRSTCRQPIFLKRSR